MNMISSRRTISITPMELVNDVHSQLNSTQIRRRLQPGNEAEVVKHVQQAALAGEHLSVAGGRHAMGGQQFRTNGVLLDMRGMDRIVSFDYEQGLVEMQGGMMWPELIKYLRKKQSGRSLQWTIAQKQTGADHLSIGGALAANAHGRGLKSPPIAADVKQFSIVTAEGELVSCSRQANKELFQLAIGGYGLFGVVTSATLQLVPRVVLRRTVEVTDATAVLGQLDERMAAGATYGDFQFAIDNASDEFLNTGILSTYSPVEIADHASGVENKVLSMADWEQLVYLAHVDKEEAFKKYCQHYLSTDGQLYSSDTFQLATYLDNYHEKLNERVPVGHSGSEVITELYVPRDRLAGFLGSAAELLRDHGANVIYGTVRLIEQDVDSFLAWAKQPWACIVLNLHVEHTAPQIERNRDTLRALIQLAILYSGTYYLTYHKFATKEQLLHCYPQFPQFCELKDKYDPSGLFWSDWFEHVRRLTGSAQTAE